MDMGKKHNTIKTKEKIKSAFTELIMEKGFNNLSVVDISERAGINRGTFYLHYTVNTICWKPWKPPLFRISMKFCEFPSFQTAIIINLCFHMTRYAMP